MNTTGDETGGFLGSKDIGGFGYGIGVSVGILLLITSITLASYFCTRAHHAPPSAPAAEAGEGQVVVVEVGLDEATIKSYPKWQYAEADRRLGKSNSSSTLACCSICLADYKPRDALRQLPECGHLFHAKCVDPWLRLHPTCPVCRTSPIPTPLSTPLAERIPLRDSVRRSDSGF